MSTQSWDLKGSSNLAIVWYSLGLVFGGESDAMADFHIGAWCTSSRPFVMDVGLFGALFSHVMRKLKRRQ